nr:PH domain-containing protein DDB_G0275795 [Ipomoea batatas]
MASDQEIASGVEALLRQSDPNAVISLNGVVQQLEAKLGLDLSHKAGFINDQINLLRSKPPPPPPQQQQSRDHFALLHHQQFPTTQPEHFYPHFALHQQHYQHGAVPPPPQQLRPAVLQQQAPPPTVIRLTAAQNVVQNAAQAPKESTTAGTKRRGGAGGLNKVCGVSPELQAIVGQPALPRTEIVKQLWAYIRKHNLQDPGNKRKIICDDALRIVFETDCTDMFKMNKLLAKHILPHDPTKQPEQTKKLKVETNLEPDNTESASPSVMISDALANFFGSEEREMLQSEALRRVLEYIKVNHQEDSPNSTVIQCDAKLQELFGCKSISTVEIPEKLKVNAFFLVLPDKQYAYLLAMESPKSVHKVAYASTFFPDHIRNFIHVLLSDCPENAWLSFLIWNREPVGGDFRGRRRGHYRDQMHKKTSKIEETEIMINCDIYFMCYGGEDGYLKGNGFLKKRFAFAGVKQHNSPSASLES